MVFANCEIFASSVIRATDRKRPNSPRSWTERAYHKLIYYNKVDKGGHYAAWEQAQLFSEEVRAGLRPLRQQLRTS
jgi:hypothetical protein